MSLFLETKVESVSGVGGSTPIICCTAWSRVAEHPVLAVARANAEVALLYEDGGAYGDHSLVSSGESDCTALAWHPHKLLLAIGWEDGSLSLTDAVSPSHQAEKHFHEPHPITLLRWSPNGTRLISADDSGSVLVFEVSFPKGLRKLCRFSASASVTRCIFQELPGLARHKKRTSNQCPKFFVAGESGAIFEGSDAQQFNEVATIPNEEIISMQFSDKTHSIYVVSKHAVLFAFTLQRDGSYTQTKKIHLALQGDGSDLVCEWTADGLLAASNKELFVRMWNVTSDQSYVLNLSDPRHMAKSEDTVNTISYNPRRRTLAGGTALGRVVMWQYIQLRSAPSEADWKILPPINLGWECAVNALNWGVGEGLLSVVLSTGLSILKEATLQCKRGHGINVLQLSSEKLIVYLRNGKIRKLSSSIRVKGTAIGENLIVLWSGTKAEVHEIAEGAVKFNSVFDTTARAITVHKQVLYAAVESRVEVLNLHGTVMKLLPFSESEGHPITVDSAGNFLVVTTDHATLKLWDISRREPKTIVPGRNLGEEVGEVTSAKVNRSGSHVTILSSSLDANGARTPLPQLLAYDVDTDKVERFGFEGAEHALCPIEQSWDAFDDSLVAVALRTEDADTVVATLFVTSDNGVLQQDRFPCDNDVLIGSEVPFTFFVKASNRSGGLPTLHKRVMRDFNGLEDVDDAVKHDLIRFSFHMAVGNMDEAFAAVKNIDSASVWRNMARMCVITRRLDVASVCLGNMASARGAVALREAANEPEQEVQLAAMAIELGMLPEAEALYRQCGRYDLLAAMYRSSRDWSKAIEVCEEHDRIHLKMTHFLYAQNLEAKAKVKKAIEHYEKCDAALREVPRMLYQMNRIGELEKYIQKKRDPKLLMWWARYSESCGRYDVALQHYKEAADFLSVVRIHCFNGDIDKARSVCEESGDLAAYYHVARHLEDDERIDEAIEMFASSKRLVHALRLAIDHQLDSFVLTLALDCPAPLQLEAARYLEGAGEFSKAVLLYERSGSLPEALELCFRTRQFESLASLSEQLTDECAPDVLARCAAFFTENEQYEKAVELLLQARQYGQALSLCLERNVRISDELAEKLTPPKPPTGKLSKEERIEHLMKLATLLREQGSFHQATKKFTQAGDKLLAMKSLLKSNDTRKIIYYASMSKKHDVYMLAANYLQNMDWHSDQEITKSIITFYTKAKALESLALFYNACAQVEIDEYRDYEKALDALNESVKMMSRAFGSEHEKTVGMERRLFLVQQFVRARALCAMNTNDMENMCLQLLDTEDLECGVRAGDVYALLSEFYYSKGEEERCLQLVERMQSQGIELKPYLNADVLHCIEQHFGAMDKTDDDDDDDSNQQQDFDADEIIN